MRSIFGLAAALILACAPVAPASAQVLDNLLARLPCEPLGDPPPPPGRRAGQAQVQAGVDAYNAWINRWNEAVVCYTAAAAVQAETRLELIDEYNNQNAQARAAQAAWLALEESRAGGRAQ